MLHDPSPNGHDGVVVRDVDDVDELAVIAVSAPKLPAAAVDCSPLPILPTRSRME
jgi:hypothetical protein